MWLANDKFKEFNHAVLKGEPGRVLKLFTELFHPDNQFSKDLLLCPQCEKTLERKMHPYLEYFVHACPDRHGAWMSPDVSSKVRDLFESQMTQSTRRRRIFRLLLLVGGGFAMMTLLTNGPMVLEQVRAHYHESRMGAGYWPLYNFQAMPVMTEENTSIKNRLEREYLMQMGKLLEGGASNRMNLDKVLKSSRSSKDYGLAFEIYRKNHRAFLTKLRSLYVPENLIPFHTALQKGAEAQLVFYAAFSEEKKKHPKTVFAQWLPHPSLRACNRAVLAAYDFLLKKYPGMDSAAKHALESRLCWFDIV